MNQESVIIAYIIEAKFNCIAYESRRKKYENNLVDRPITSLVDKFLMMKSSLGAILPSSSDQCFISTTSPQVYKLPKRI